MFSGSGKAEIINYDEKGKKSVKHRNELMPHNPGIFTCALIGPTNSGKTNVLLNMLYDFLNYDKVYIYIYAQNNQQPVYQKLKEHFVNVAEKHDLDLEDIFHFGSTLADVVPVNDMDDTSTKVVVFDDFMLSDKNSMSVVLDFFSRGRHKKCIVIFLSQSYSLIDITIRRNLRVYLIWAVSRGRDISLIQSDIAPEMDAKLFKKIFHAATVDPHSFLYCDRYAKPQDKFRKNFDGMLSPGALINLK